MFSTDSERCFGQNQMSRKPFAVGDRVRAYDYEHVQIGTVDYVTSQALVWISGVTLSNGNTYRWEPFHPKQLRRLKPVEKCPHGFRKGKCYGCFLIAEAQKTPASVARKAREFWVDASFLHQSKPDDSRHYYVHVQEVLEDEK